MNANGRLIIAFPFVKGAKSAAKIMELKVITGAYLNTHDVVELFKKIFKKETV